MKKYTREEIHEFWDMANEKRKMKQGQQTAFKTKKIKGFDTSNIMTWDVLRGLRIGKEADDILINVWASELMRHWMTGPSISSKQTYIMNTHFYSDSTVGWGLEYGTSIVDLIRMCTKYTVDTIDERGLLGMDYIAVPIHCGDRHHWTFGFVDFVHKRFEYYDSMMRSRNEEEAYTFSKNMKRFFKEYASMRCIPVPSFDTWEVTCNIGPEGSSMPQQKKGDGINCGYYMLAALEQRVRGVPFVEASTLQRYKMSAHFMLRCQEYLTEEKNQTT